MVLVTFPVSQIFMFRIEEKRKKTKKTYSVQTSHMEIFSKLHFYIIFYYNLINKYACTFVT